MRQITDVLTAAEVPPEMAGLFDGELRGRF